MVYKKTDSREKRRIRVRRKISGKSPCPRLSVFRSNRFLYAQLIDDQEGKTLVSANSLKDGKGSNKNSAAIIGKIIAERALEKKITRAIFDRGCNKYHGVIKEVAENARKAGLQI